MDYENLKLQAEQQLKNVKTLKELDLIWLNFFGKKGVLSQSFAQISALPLEKRKEEGAKLNLLRNSILEIFQQRKDELEKEFAQAVKDGKFDITIPGAKIEMGHAHPLTQVIEKCVEIFERLGFEVVEGPEIETEYYNFDTLNIPKEHPARDLWDTIYLKSKVKSKESKVDEKLILRTHTSPVQIRYMEKHQPPIRIVAPGRVFRYEATDATHSHTFYQIEGLAIDYKDKNPITLANLRAILENFFKGFFGKETKIRIRPGYFPFVEPGIEVDITCVKCNGSGCNVCKNSGWLEVGGAGMVHPKVFEYVKYNPADVQGFAFGIGIERLAMLKFEVDDIRLFYNGDLRFIGQF